jgi:putative FmdB family regulatory protein
MPIYEYACEACGHQTEIMHRVSDPPATECPACHASALVKQVSAAGFRLKGGGWYETDFKSSGKKNLVGDSAAADSPSPDAGEAKSHSCAAGGCGCAPKTTSSSPSSPPAA